MMKLCPTCGSYWEGKGGGHKIAKCPDCKRRVQMLNLRRWRDKHNIRVKEADEGLMEFKEIARRLGVTATTVHRDYKRAMEKLRKRVNHEWLLELLAPEPGRPGVVPKKPSTPVSQWDLRKYSSLRPRGGLQEKVN